MAVDLTSVLNSGRMHKSARGFGYPSESSWTKRHQTWGAQAQLAQSSDQGCCLWISGSFVTVGTAGSIRPSRNLRMSTLATRRGLGSPGRCHRGPCASCRVQSGGAHPGHCRRAWIAGGNDRWELLSADGSSTAPTPDSERAPAAPWPGHCPLAGPAAADGRDSDQTSELSWSPSQTDDAVHVARALTLPRAMCPARPRATPANPAYRCKARGQHIEFQHTAS